MPRGRPVPKEARRAREAAVAAHERRFLGHRCPRCGGIERFTSSGGCVRCVACRRFRTGRKAEISANRLRRSVAREAGATMYEGMPCRRCSGVLRYTAGKGRCVACMRAALAKRDREVERKRLAASRARHREAANARARVRNKRPEVKAARSARVLTRYHADPDFRLKIRMSKAIRRALGGAKKNRRPWENLVGYTIEDLRIHLKRQFVKGMSWHNIDQWQVDHIVPIACFGRVDPGGDAFRACWALSNLRPLWKSLNHAKGAKREHLV